MSASGQDDMVSESSPLLHRELEQFSHPPPTFYNAIKRHVQQWQGVYSCGTFIVVLNMPLCMGEAARLRMFEMSLCRDYYAIHDPSRIEYDGHVAEQLCKLQPIQSSLARMRGFINMLEAIPGLVLALPYGILADKKGKRLVAGLCLLGFLLKDCWTFVSLFFYKTLPTRAIYAAPLMAAIGGGSVVMTSILLAIIAESAAAERRTRAFFWLQVATLTSEFLGPPLGSLLMAKIGPYFGFLSGTVLMAMGSFLLLLLPSKTARSRQSKAPMSGNAVLDDVPTDVSTDDIEVPKKPESFVTRLSGHFHHGLVAMLSNKRLLVSIATMVVSKLTRPLLELTMQYMSVKFGWTISQANVVLSIHAAAQIALFAVILPPISSWLIRRGEHGIDPDIVLAKASIILLGSSSALMGLAPTAPSFILAMVVQVLGSGYSTAMRSLLTTLVSKEHLSRLFTTVSVFDGLAATCASPILELLFSWGIKLGGTFVSLPYFVAAGLFGCAALSVFLLIATKPHRP